MSVANVRVVHLGRSTCHARSGRRGQHRTGARTSHAPPRGIRSCHARVLERVGTSKEDGTTCPLLGIFKVIRSSEETSIVVLDDTESSHLFQDAGVSHVRAPVGDRQCSHVISTRNAPYVYVGPWSEFPVVPFYPHYPHAACLASEHWRSLTASLGSGHWRPRPRNCLQLYQQPIISKCNV